MSHQLKNWMCEYDVPEPHDDLSAMDWAADEIAKLQDQLDWWGHLVDRGNMGTKETPSLKAYIEQMEDQNASLAGIVRAVGTAGGYENNNLYMIDCVVCAMEREYHSPDCPIGQAEEWVAKNPAEQDSSDKDGGA